VPWSPALLQTVVARVNAWAADAFAVILVADLRGVDAGLLEQS
jgi:hypothetical protein